MIIYQKFINRCDLQNNPKVKYLFGDNLKRQGMGGQAGHMRGEPNAIGIATKKLPSRFSDSYFSDDQYRQNITTLNNDMLPAIIHLESGGTLVIPTDGLGTGLSELPERAPRTNIYLLYLMEELELTVIHSEYHKGL